MRAPDGPITVRPIELDDIDRLPMECQPDQFGHWVHVFLTQDAMGVAAWCGDRCLAAMPCYRVALWEGHNLEWEGCWSTDPGWWSGVAREHGLSPEDSVWCHDSVSFDEPPDGPRFLTLARALTKASATYARENGYAAALARAAPDRMPRTAAWLGLLPKASLHRLGFRDVEVGRDLPPPFAPDDVPSVAAAELHTLGPVRCPVVALGLRDPV